MPLRRFAVIGAALIGEDGVRDVPIAPRNDAAAVAIGGKSWPFDIRLRPWVFRPHIGLLPLRYLAGGEMRSYATNGLESGRFQGFLTGNMSDQVIMVRPAIPKGCPARSLAQGCRSSLWTMASIGWFVAAATRSNPLQNLGTAAAG